MAKVGQPRTDEEWAVLRYELDAFVAEGEYATGLERILRSYLANLDKPSQPAVWISGFYGSRKSHLIRVLESLWTDRVFPDKASAHGIVHLPDDVRAHFRELETRGQQFGGRFAGSTVALTAILFWSRPLGRRLPTTPPTSNRTSKPIIPGVSA